MTAVPDRRRYARTPDTVAVLALAAVSGLAQVVAGEYSGSVLRLVSTGWAAAWAWSLIVSSVVALAGVLWRDELTGWVLELSGRLTLCCTAAAYTLALAAAAESVGSAFAIALAAAIALASAWRVWQLTRRLRQWWVYIHEGMAA